MDLRPQSTELSAGFPPLLAAAHRLAGAYALGAHGRRRAGVGEEFWQYRPAHAQDGARAIDWRRSARSDDFFIRQQEWQTAQQVHFWVDRAQSMQFASGDVSKGARASVLALGLAILLNKAGERFGLLDNPRPLSTGQAALDRMTRGLSSLQGEDYGLPPIRPFPVGSQAVYFSDFLGDWEALVSSLAQAADAGVRGCLVQVLDPVEAAFPFEGRLIFESMTGATRFQSLQAKGLREAYLDRLATRQDALRSLGRRTGWTYLMHATDQPAQEALTWIYRAIERT